MSPPDKIPPIAAFCSIRRLFPRSLRRPRAASIQFFRHTLLSWFRWPHGESPERCPKTFDTSPSFHGSRTVHGTLFHSSDLFYGRRHINRLLVVGKNLTERRQRRVRGSTRIRRRRSRFPRLRCAAVRCRSTHRSQGKRGHTRCLRGSSMTRVARHFALSVEVVAVNDIIFIILRARCLVGLSSLSKW